MPTTRKQKLFEFTEVVKKNGHTTITSAQVRTALKNYFGVKDNLVIEYFKELHKLGLIESTNSSEWRIK